MATIVVCIHVEWYDGMDYIPTHNADSTTEHN